MACTVAVLTAAGFVAPGQPAAQNTPARVVVESDTADRNGDRDRPADRTSVDRGSILDTPVDRRTYVLGPGDGLDIAIVGDFNRQFSTEVSPEGTVLIPGIGVATVLGRTLEQAESTVRAAVYRYYRNVDVSVSISRIRTFKVYVVGAVQNPGMRVATSATRVSEVVPAASQASALPTVARRNILLRRTTGDSLRIDLARFLQAGDWSANPTLREGDIAIVPALDRVIHVYGRVQFPGAYEFRPGETLADLISVANAGGSFPASTADTVRVSRFTDRQTREFFSFSRTDVIGERGRRFVLQPFDAVYVPELSGYMEQKTVTLIGQVARPGVYPVQPGRTTVRELVMQAGGLTPDASLVDATLTRRTDIVESRELRDLRNLPPEFLTEEERQILILGSAGEQENVVVDFQKLFTEGQSVFDHPVRANDVLTIPEAREEVGVVGAVLQPGLVTHAQGRNVDWYVSQAGGYSEKAARGDIVILRAKQGTRVSARDVAMLDPGDKIIIPFRRERNWQNTIQSTSAVVSSVSALVLSIMYVIGR